jgi:carotenoid cleavage dioxygenase
MNLFIFLYLFINPFLVKEFKPVKYEIKKNIVYVLPKEEQDVINKINGFYGQVGPNPKYYTESDDYHMFDGDGMIHGVFFENGNITYRNQWIKTDKFNYQNIFHSNLVLSIGSLYKLEKIFLLLLYNFFHKLKLVPNMMGNANTALWYNNNKLYALNERDNPYELKLDFNQKNIETIKKINIQNTEYFTAHPKKSTNDDIYIQSYSNFFPELTLMNLDNRLKLKKYKKINTNYSGIVHDIAMTDNNIIFCDIPYQFNLTRIYDNKIPFFFDKSKNNRFCAVSKDLSNIDWYDCNESFFIFHYGDSYEDKKNIYFNAVVHNEFNMESLSQLKNINIPNYSKYRRFILNKKTKKVKVQKKKEFENINVEFPVKHGKFTLLSIFGNNIDIIGFLVVNDFNILNTVYFKNRKIYGEPSFIEIDNKLYVISYIYDDLLNNYLYFYCINTRKSFEIKIDVSLNKGFHSIFINKY